MKYSFNAFGHENIEGTHKNTLEFTKDDHLTKKGDCIIGISSDFELSEIKKLFEASKDGKVKMSLVWPNGQEEIIFYPNLEFKSNHEIVVRKGEFSSERTLGIRANKASFELSRNLIGFLKDEKAKITIIMENNN